MDESDDPIHSRRHSMASFIYDCWVLGEGCSAEIALAAHFFDGSYTALEIYIIEGAPAVEPSPCWVKFESAANLSYERFSAEYMATNTPVLIGDLTSLWPANEEWTTAASEHFDSEDTSLVPDLEMLAERYGDAEVQVEAAAPVDNENSDTSNSTVQGYSQTRAFMRFADFAQDPSGGYVKDWHFRAAFPSDAADMVPTPPLFQDDWLNSYARRHDVSSSGADINDDDKHRSSDYEFVYVGGAGTATHLHTDVVGSNSWSAHICGVKRWRFLPPHLAYLCRDVFGHRLAPDFLHTTPTSPDLMPKEKAYSSTALHTSKTLSSQQRQEKELSANACGRGAMWAFPLLHAARYHEVKQRAGSALFVPSEWLHTVANLEPSLSVNANWFNAHNLKFCFRRLRRGHAIKHARDQLTLAREALKRRTLSMATTSSILPSASSDEGPQEQHCHDNSSCSNSSSSISSCSDSSTTLPPPSLPLQVPDDELSADLPGGEMPAGKAPFDIEDLVRLMAWKARSTLAQRPTAALLPKECSGGTFSMNIQAMMAVAKATSHEECFPESIRRDAAEILDLLSGAEESGPA